MTLLNENYLNLSDNYLFARIANEKKKYKERNNNTKLIDLSIGDVSLPLVKSCIDGMHKGTDILSSKDTFTGYPPSSGHEFLKNEIIKNDYMNIKIDNDEIFISDSSKSDISNILDIFSDNITVAIQDPVYPVYVDSNIMRGNKIIFIHNLDSLPKTHIDIIYLCFPNNPTGDTISKEKLKKIIDYAIENDTVVFFDGAYEAFIESKDTVHSIYEIEGAKKVAVEFRSYSKTAGFTSLRLAYTVIPKEINLQSKLGKYISLNSLFKRLKDTKYNGPSYISEYAIYNLYNTNKMDELKENIEYYKRNTRLLSSYFNKNSSNIINSPYIWFKCIDNMSSWDYFYYLLENYGIIGTPGSGFGLAGDGHFRLTGFASYEDTKEAIRRLKNKAQ